jgi:integrase
LKISKILTPTQWEKLRSNLHPYYQIICDAILHTGLRSDSEFWRFADNPQWYDSGKIQLPDIPGVCKSRTIRLSYEGKESVEAMITLIKNGNGKRGRGSIRDALRRAALGKGWVVQEIDGAQKRKYRKKTSIDPEGVNAYMLRRTIIAWLVSCYPEKKYEIMHSLGLSEKTMRQFVGILCPRNELEKARKHLKGW